MSLKQMIDAAEARAKTQRERKLGLSCTQDQEEQEEAVCCSPTINAHCPENAPRFLGSAIISVLGSLGTYDLQDTHSHRTYESEGTFKLSI